MSDGEGDEDERREEEFCLLRRKDHFRGDEATRKAAPSFRASSSLAGIKLEFLSITLLQSGPPAGLKPTSDSRQPTATDDLLSLGNLLPHQRCNLARSELEWVALTPITASLTLSVIEYLLKCKSELRHPHHATCYILSTPRDHQGILSTSSQAS